MGRRSAQLTLLVNFATTIMGNNTMNRFLSLIYGIAAYFVFFVTFLYAVGFVEGLIVPKGIDSGPVVSLGEALIVNILLMTVFALQHSVMARPQFKKWWTQLVPKSVERSTYVLFASLALALVFWQWRPIPGVVWEVKGRTIAAFLVYLGVFVWVLVFFCLSIVH